MPGRVGIYGGTFDPLHVGHLVTAVNVRYALDLDPLLVVPAGDPWQKSDERDVTPGVIRLEMVAASLAGVEGVAPCDIEVRRQGPSYTADTLAELRRRHPGAELFVVLGTDAAALLPTWERAEEVRELATLVVVTRPGAEADAPPDGWRYEVVEIPQLEMSSSEIRERVCDGRPIDFLVTPAVQRLIHEHGLYAPRT